MTLNKLNIFLKINNKKMNNKKTKINIQGRLIGEDYPPFVIAEIGINHDGDFEKAKTMVMEAYNSGAECVKFQCHVVEDEMIKNDIIPSNAKESIWEMMKRCSFSEEQDLELKKYVEELGMIYLSTPFSRAAANRLQKMNVSAYKIGSGECNNYPLVKHIASFGKPIILSTGMNDLESISKSVDILNKAKVDYALLHCTSMYPTPYDKVRLRAINEMKEFFPGVILGLSDHSLGIYTCLAAIPLGASILEKHFTVNKNWPGSDVPISIDADELKDLIKGSKAIHKALEGRKVVLGEEEGTIKFAYACVVAIKDIKDGEIFTSDNIWVKRPGTGEMKADEYDKVLGKESNQDIQKDTQLKQSMIKNYD